MEKIVIDHAAAANNGINEPGVSGTSNLDTRTRKQKSTERIHCAALCLGNFVFGWNDGSTGPLLPRIQEFYHVRLTPCSICFPLTHILYSGWFYYCVFDFHFRLCCKSVASSTSSPWLFHPFTIKGYIFGALVNVHLTDRLGFGKVCRTYSSNKNYLQAQGGQIITFGTTVLCVVFIPATNIRNAGAALQAIAYALESSGSPFPVFVMAFAINGCGTGLQVSRISLKILY